MDGEQVHALHTQPLHAELQLRLKQGRVLLRRNFGLKNAAWVRTVRHGPAQLPLRTSVMPCCFDVTKTKRNSTFEGALQQLLGLGRDRLRFKITPALLKAHSSEGENRHRELGPSKAACGKSCHTPQSEGMARGSCRRGLAGDGNPRGSSSWASSCRLSAGNSSKCTQ